MYSDFQSLLCLEVERNFLHIAFTKYFFSLCSVKCGLSSETTTLMEPPALAVTWGTGVIICVLFSGCS